MSASVIRRTAAVVVLALACLAPDAVPTGPYANDFEKAAVDSFPEPELMKLNGALAVKKDGEKNHVLELPGEPIDSMGFMFGPDGATQVSARIRADKTGKRFPEFGIALGGAGGPRLWVMPAVGELQIVHNDEEKARVPYAWKPGTWTHLRFRFVAGGKGKLEGKAWAEGEKEPEKWMIGLEGWQGIRGRPSAWGTPYSGRAIAFDDIAADVAK
jgi:hypothetical protein